MRITSEDGEKLRKVQNVYLALTDDEASELRDALNDFLVNSKAEAGWHVHVSDTDFQTEVTVYREDDPDMIV